MSKPEKNPPSEKPRPAPSRGGGAARALGWVLGAAVIVGTSVLVFLAVTGPDKIMVAAPAKPPRVCPPVVSIPARAIGQPVDDVLNIRPGMNARDVEETIKCVSEDYAGKTAEFANPGAAVGQPTRPVLIYKRGDEVVTVALFGPKGLEQTAGVWREVYFDVGAGPPLPQIEQQLATHFGAPHEARDTPNGGRVLNWTYAPDGRPLRRKPADGDVAGMVSYMASGWKVAGCIKNAKPEPAVAPEWNPECGLTIRAEIDPNLGDRAHTARWRLVLLDQATLARLEAPAAPATKS